MKEKLRAVAAILLVAMLLSIFLPATTLPASASSDETGTLKTEDIFGGSFSPKEKVAAPGETFDVTFSLCPTMDAPNTVISFVLPADLVKLVGGNRVWSGDLKKGESLTLTLTLVANGEVAACVKADVEAWLSGKDYRSAYYLRVATPNAGFSSTAASGSMEPGSLSAVNLEYVSKTSNVESSRAIEDSIAPLSPGNFEVAGRFWFVDEGGGWSSARYMLVRLRDNDDGGFSATQWTDGEGKFDFVVANSPGLRSPILDIIAEGAWDWKATDDGGGQYWWSTGVLQNNVPDGWLYNNTGLGVASNSETLQAGDAVFLEMNWVYWSSGVYWSRSKVTIRFPSGTWPHSHGDYIDLPSKSTAGWDHVTVQHEDGHCVMYTLYGNTFPFTAHPSESHYVFSEKDGGFAIIEGWAEFMQCVVDNNANNLADWYSGHGGNIETNDWFNCIDTGDMDGNDIEGSCASILWDILDPVDIAGDNDHMAWGYDEIFTVMQNDNPGDMLAFWNDWSARWPTNSTSKGPLCSIYYHYGIDEDWFNPWGSIVINGGATYTNSRTVTLTLQGNDWGVGVKYMRFSEDWGNTWGGWYNYATTFTYTITSANDGYKYIDVQFADFWWLSNGGTIYDGIWLDTVKPTGSIIIGSGNPTYTTTTSVTLYLTYSDATSGVYQVRYGNAGGTWGAWEAPNATKAWTLSSGDGNKGVYYEVKDNAGNIQQFYDGIVLDTTPPNGSIIIGAGNPTYTNTTSVTLYLNYSDATSGVYQVRYGNAGGTWGAWEAPAATKAWTLSSGDGSKGVWYEVKDNVGFTQQFYDGIVLDTVAPTGSIVVGSGNPTYTMRTSVTLYLTYSDATSGVSQVRYSNDGVWDTEPWEAPAATKAWTLTAGDGVKTVRYQVKDNAGLLSATYSDTIILQNPMVNAWNWGGNTTINSVAAADVDGDGQVEIVTGGYYYDGTRNVAQLIVRAGSDLSVDRLITWFWTGNTVINSVAIGDVDADAQVEIVTGGSFFDGTRNVAQLVVWNGASLAVDTLATWYWTGNTVINSVAVGNVDGDAQVEIITGGSFFDGTRNVAQLVEWNGASLAVDRLTTWYWTGNTVINSVAVGDVDADAKVEIVTGGSFFDGTRNVAQLVEWNGASLAVDRMTSWYWTSNTAVNSVAIGDVDADGQTEIVTGGYFNDGTRNVAQLVVWTGSALAVDRLTSWYWTSNTVINSVALGDPDGDGQVEIATGGYYYDGTRNVAQLVSWSGSTLAAESIKTWYWVSHTVINSVCVSDVNGDASKEIVTGGAYYDGARWNAQLAVWGL